MAVSPSTDNYTLGKGIVYFNKKNVSTGLYEGERDLGNAPSFSFNIALEKLEHFSSRGGLKAKDKEIISQISPSINFTLDEINKENIALLTLGDTVSVVQTAGVAVEEAVIGKPGLRQAVANREIGSYIVNHGTVSSGPFVVGETLTASVGSVGTAEIIAVGTGQLVVIILTGAFDDTATLTGAGGATAAQDGDAVWNPGVILVATEAGVPKTGYSVNTALKDDKIGRILFTEGGDVTADEALEVTYNYAAITYTVIRAFNNTQVEGSVRFVSDNPAGIQQELQAWRVSLTPSGETAMIGDDWSTLGFTGEVLKDETGHPLSPYMDFVIR